MVPSHFKVSPLQAVVLLHHVTHSAEASNDADRTVGEIIVEIDESGGMLSKGLLESALYCCNMEAEDGKFWHPLGHNFDRFISGMLINKHLHFDKYYNVIYEVKHGAKKKASERDGLGQDTRPSDGNLPGDEVV